MLSLLSENSQDRIVLSELQVYLKRTCDWLLVHGVLNLESISLPCVNEELTKEIGCNMHETQDSFICR